jgi:hypothetical protein
MTALALVTFGDVTKNRNDPISVMPPKMAKASTVMCHCPWHYRSKLYQRKHGLISIFCCTDQGDQGKWLWLVLSL